MKSKIAVVAVAAFAAAALFFVYHATQGDEARIRRMCENAARLGRRTLDESALQGALVCRDLSKMAADECRCSVDSAAYSFSQKDLASLLLAARNAAGTVCVELKRVDVEVSGDEARVTGGVDFSGSGDIPMMFPPYERSFAASLERKDGKWLFTQVEFTPGK